MSILLTLISFLNLHVVADHEDALTLGHMLFNITTLSVFYDVLAETQTSKPKVRLLSKIKPNRFHPLIHLLRHQLFIKWHSRSLAAERIIVSCFFNVVSSSLSPLLSFPFLQSSSSSSLSSLSSHHHNRHYSY